MVIALDKHKKPLGFITERRARKFFERHDAVMYRQFPMIVILKKVDASTIPDLPQYRIKVDPGSQVDGIAIVNDETHEFMYGMQIKHRGYQVKQNLATRRTNRRNRRNRETLYRRCKFDAGTFKQDNNHKIAPSILSVIGNTEHWINLLCKWINITSASIEAVRFDTQLMDNPNISGEEYQHGTLHGTEVREYLLDKFQHTCQYCGGESGDPILEWEHMVPKSRGGSDKVSNATLSCHTCNQEKGNKTPAEWLEKIQSKSHKTKLDKARLEGLDNVIKQQRTGGSNRYCAWVNITRKKLEKFLFEKFKSVECSSGGRTKYNRTTLGYLKDHQYDALCIGTMPEGDWIDRTHGYYLLASATGRGTRYRGKNNKCSIITQKLAPRAKRIFGFMNGDIVKADVPHREKRPYKYEGHHIGRVMTRATGSFDIRTTTGKKVNVDVKFVKLVQYANGYEYAQRRTTTKTCQGSTGRSPLGH